MPYGSSRFAEFRRSPHLPATLDKNEFETTEPIRVGAPEATNRHDLDDLPGKRASDTDYFKYDADIERAFLAFEADGKAGNLDNDPRH